MDQSFIRNFAIIAHIDHGKSTLADRFLEITGTVQKRDLTEQTLDSSDISRERGITIKLAPVTMNYKLGVRSLGLGVENKTNGSQLPTPNYQLNLIDTPGHVDFSYEVERSLAACEGVILLVDATQGIQAQTLSNFYKAKKLGLVIIPVINKIDSPIARVEETESELAQLGKFDKLEILKISAKTGQGVSELLEAVIRKVPPPSGKPENPPRALVFSSLYDPKRGVVAFVRIVDGEIKTSDTAKFLITGATGNISEIGKFRPKMKPEPVLKTGEVGFVATNIKQSSLIQVGDTLATTADCGLWSTVVSLPGYHLPQPVVFVSFFPVDPDEYNKLLDALNQLKLNDSAIQYSLTSSKALGRGFRCGFLGHLHAEVSQERLEKEFDLSIIATAPTVEYQTPLIKSVQLDKLDQSEELLEPWVLGTIIVPQDYCGSIITLCEERRGILKDMTYHGKNVTLKYELPLAEIITDFFDKLKSCSSGYASVDYIPLEFRAFNWVKLDILINHEPIDAFSQILEKSRAETFGKFLVEKLKEIIPRQQIPVPIQAAINGSIVARADIPAFRKDVTAKLYGGDVTRRNKLLEKQKKGKEKMKSIGKVTIPNDTFLKVFKT
jgi:GTP-binding protein LepA